VIAGRDNDSQRRHVLAQTHHFLSEKPLSLCRWLGNIEHVARNEQRVGVFITAYFDDFFQYGIVLLIAVVAIEILADMPVGSVDDFHCRAFVFSKLIIFFVLNLCLLENLSYL